MQKLTMQHELNCGVEEFWKFYFDKELSRELFVDKLGFRDYRVVAQTETDASIVRKVSAEPTMSLGALSKVFGSSFGYEEEGTFDKATKIWRWKMTPRTMGDKIRVNGVLKAIPLGENKVRREVEIEISADVFMMGGTIEDTFKKQLIEGWAKGAAAQNEWLAQQAK